MGMIRKVEEEMLDVLAHDDPKAVHSRRDLRLINTLQGNYRWLARQMKKHLLPREQGAEWGAGAGDLSRYLKEKETLPEGVRIDGWDSCPRPSIWPENWGWEQHDLTTIKRVPYDFVVGNLIFHQFEDQTLYALGKHLQQSCRLIFACEPVRRKRHLWQLELLRPMRLSQVTWNDARISIGAGFRAGELPEKLGLSKENWDWFIRETALGAYRFLARRKGDIPMAELISEGVPV